MRKFIINVNGNQYEVEVEEIKEGISPAAPAAPTPRPTPAAQAAPAAAPAAPAAPAAQPAPAKEEVVVAAGAETVEAPMPGTILKVNVGKGEEVTEGQVLAVLEAMKMENEILAPRAGKVADIAAAEGASVNTGDPIIVLE